MRIAFLIAGLCLVLMIGYGQREPDKIQPVQIGEQMPDITLSPITHYPVSKIHLSEIKCPLVIFDFFATWCGSCLKALPKLDSLQKQYGDALQIIVVTEEPYSKLQHLFKNGRIASNIYLPFISSDSVLKTYFPHQLLPHEVWLNKDRKVIAITDAEKITASNIQTAITKQQIHLPVKQDEMDYDVSRPLLDGGNGGSSSQVQYRSMLTGKLGLPSGGKYYKDDHQQKRSYINRTVLSLYQQVYDFAGNRVILEVSNPAHYYTAADSLLYCYEQITPLNTSEAQLNAWMTQDLDRYFGLQGRMEERDCTCYVLKVTDSAKLPLSASTTRFIQTGNQYHQQVLHHYPLSFLVGLLNSQQPTDPPVPIVLDETHFSKSVDLRLRVSDIHNLEALNKTLTDYGLSLVPAIRSLRVFVLKEKPFTRMLTTEAPTATKNTH